MVAAHEDGRGDDLEPGWDTSTSQLFHEEAAHRQFFAKGQEETDKHHHRDVPNSAPENSEWDEVHAHTIAAPRVRHR